MQRSQDMDRVLADLPSIEQPRDSPPRSIRVGNTEEFERARSAGGVFSGVLVESDPPFMMYTYPGDDGYKEAAERHQTGPNPQQPFRQGIDEPPRMTHTVRRGNEPPQLTPLPRRDDEPLQLTPLPRRVRQKAESYDDAMKRVRGDLGKGKMY
jgi:hypothetical protein